MPGLQRLIRFAACLACLLLSAATVAGVGAIDPGIAGEIESIEFQGFSNPAKALSLANTLLTTTPESAPQELRLQALRGVFMGDLGRHAEVAKLAQTLDRRGTPVAISCAEMILANDDWTAGNVTSANEHIERANRLTNKDTDDVLRYYIGMVRAGIAKQQGRFKDALAVYQETADLIERMNSLVREIHVNDQMADLFNSVGERDKALAHSQQAVDAATLLADPGALADAWTMRASILSEKSPDAARQAMDNAIRFAKQSGAEDRIAITLTNLSDMDLKRHRYQDALREARAAVDACKSVADVTCALVANLNAGEALIGLGNMAEGKAKMDAAVDFYDKTGEKAQQEELLSEYGEVLERAGDYKGAIEQYHRERKLAKEIYEGDRQKALLEMDTRYQTERKEKQIALLNRENQLKAAELQNRTLMQWIYVLGAALMAVGLAVIALLYRKARVANLKLQASNELLKVSSERDPLSGLYNRRYFQEAIRTRVERGALHCGLLLFDIDHFKRINDGAGHAAGDAVIVEVAHRIQAATRGSDFVVRWGGEEFLAALAPMPLDQLNKLAERLLRAIADTPVRYGSTDIPVTVSIGFANFPLSEELLWLDWERAVNLIDMALYVAKAEGRNRACGVVHVTPGGPEVLDAIEADFHNACREGRVRLNVIEGPTLGAGHVAT